MSRKQTISREKQPKQEKRGEPESKPKADKLQLKQTPSGSCEINPQTRRPRSSESCERVGIIINRRNRNKTMIPPSVHIKREAPMHARKHSTDSARPSPTSNSSCEQVRRPIRDGVRLRSRTISPAVHRQDNNAVLKKMLDWINDPEDLNKLIRATLPQWEGCLRESKPDRAHFKSPYDNNLREALNSEAFVRYPSKGTKQRGAGARLKARDAYDDDKDDEDSYGAANSAYGDETKQGDALKSKR